MAPAERLQTERLTLESLLPIVRRRVRSRRPAGQLSSRDLTPYFLLAPALLYLLVMVAYPWLWTLLLSFREWNPVVSEHVRFVGLRNYERIVADPLFSTALSATLYLTAVSVVMEFFLGLGGALLLSTEFRASRIIRTLVIVPMIIAPAIASLMWKLFLSVEYGLINYFLSLLGIAPVLWTGSPEMSIPTVAIVEIWQNTPFVILVLLAGIQSIPSEQYEAALVDGASVWQRFWRITLPWLKPLMVIVILFRAMFIVRTFETVMLLLGSSGGVGNSAMVLGILLFQYAFRYWRLGAGAAVAYIILLVTLLIAVWPLFALNRMMRESRGA